MLTKFQVPRFLTWGGSPAECWPLTLGGCCWLEKATMHCFLANPQITRNSILSFFLLINIFKTSAIRLSISRVLSLHPVLLFHISIIRSFLGITRLGSVNGFHQHDNLFHKWGLRVNRTNSMSDIPLKVSI